MASAETYESAGDGHGGDFLKDLMLSKPVAKSEFDCDSMASTMSSLPAPNSEKSMCRACASESYHGPYCKVHTNGYNSLYKMAIKNGESENNPQFVRFINIFGTRKKGWARPGNPVIACSVLVAFIAKFPAGKAERGKLRGQMVQMQTARDDGARQEENLHNNLLIYDFEYFVKQTTLNRGWDFSKATDMWNEFDIPENFGDWEGPPYAKKRLQIPTWVFCTKSKDSVQTRYKDTRITEHSKSVQNVSEAEHRQAIHELSLNMKIADGGLQDLEKIGKRGTQHVLCSSSAMEQFEFMEELLTQGAPSGRPQQGSDSGDSDKKDSTDVTSEEPELAEQTTINKKYRTLHNKACKAILEVRTALREGVLALHIEAQVQDDCDCAGELHVVKVRNALALSWLSETMRVNFPTAAVTEIKDVVPTWEEVPLENLASATFEPTITYHPHIADGPKDDASPNKLPRVESPATPSAGANPVQVAVPTGNVVAVAASGASPVADAAAATPTPVQVADCEMQFAVAASGVSPVAVTEMPPPPPPVLYLQSQMPPPPPPPPQPGPQVAVTPTGEPTDMEMKDAPKDVETEFKQRLLAMQRIHQQLQGKSPVELFDSFVTKHALLARVESLKQGAKTTSALDIENDFLDSQMAMTKQLATSVKKGAKDMLKVVNEFSKFLDAAKAATQKKAKEEEEARVAAQEAAARETVLKMKHATIFALNVETLGHNNLENVLSLEEANAKLRNVELFPPFLVTDDGINSFLANAKVAAVFTQFCSGFPTSEVCKQKSRTSAKPPAFISGELKTLVASQLFASAVITREDGLIPSLSDVCDTVTVNGYLGKAVGASYEPSFLGSCRLMFDGSLHVLMASIASVSSYLKNPLIDSHIEMMSHLDEEKIKALPSHMLYKAVVTKGQMLVTPPGWVTLWASAKLENCAFIRSQFVPRGGRTQHQELVKCCVSSSTKQEAEQQASLLTLLEATPLLIAES